MQLNDFLTTGAALVSALAAVVSVFVLRPRAKQTERIAKEANTIATGANDTAAASLRIAELSLLLSQDTAARERNLALIDPLEEVAKRLKRMTDRPNLKMYDWLPELSESIQAHLSTVRATFDPESKVVDFVICASQVLRQIGITGSSIEENLEIISPRYNSATRAKLQDFDQRVRDAARLLSGESHNILLRDSDSPKWDEVIEDCAEVESEITNAAASVFMTARNMSRQEVANEYGF